MISTKSASQSRLPRAAAHSQGLRTLVLAVIAVCAGMSWPAPASADSSIFDRTPNVQFADVTGDGLADAIAINSTGIWVRPSNGSEFDVNQQSNWGISPDDIRLADYGIFFADCTGDGKADAIIVLHIGIEVFESTGTSFKTTNAAWTNWGTPVNNHPFYGNAPNTFRTYFADVTGDNRADAIAVNTDGVYVLPSVGNAFSHTGAKWISTAFYGSRGTFFAPVDGDNRADAIAVNEDGVYVRYSNGSSFPGPAVKVTNGPFYGNVASPYSIAFADVSGDGGTDAIVVNGDGTYVIPGANGAFRDVFSNWTGTGYYADNQFFADVTGGPGGADAIVVRNDSGVFVRRSNGGSFDPPVNWTGVPFFGNTITCTTGVLYSAATGCSSPSTGGNGQSCGNQNQQCCMGTGCTSGLVCQANVCKAPAPVCGGNGQPCCTNSNCQAGLTCQSAQCLPAPNNCATSELVTVNQCFNLDGSASSFYTPDSVTVWGCGVDDTTARNNAAASLAGVGFPCLLSTAVPGCCTYTAQQFPGCFCPQ